MAEGQKNDIASSARGLVVQLYSRCAAVLDVPQLPAWEELAEGERVAGMSTCDAAFEFIAGGDPAFITTESFEPTMIDCSDEGEWRETLEKYPRAVEKSHLTRSEIDLAYESVCKVYPSSKVC